MNEQQVKNVLACACGESLDSLKDSIAWLRTQIRDECRLETGRTLSQREANAVLAYTLSRVLVTKSILETIHDMGAGYLPKKAGEL